jgi:hypothetical protein
MNPSPNTEFEKKRQAIQLLDNLGDLSYEELKEYFREDALELVRIMLLELTDSECLPDPMTPDIFAELIRKLRNTKRMWGRRLGDALILSADKAESGDLETAIIVLEEFMKICPSRYFKGHAQNQIEYYTKRTGAKR